MKFIDRTEESKRLTKSMNMDKASFIVIYGRRRIGKSTLIKKVITDDDIYFLADKSESRHQISLLAKMVAQKIADFDKVNYPDWESLLRALNHRTTRKFTLCFDELPYIVQQSPEFPSILQKLIDEGSLKYNILVCGSSQQMMYGLVLDATAPLYGRADTILRLKPLKPNFISEALHTDAINSIEEYSVWGGVPRYWELRSQCESLSDALWTNILSVNGILYDEPSKLLHDDIRDIAKAYTILSLIAGGANKMSEIASRCALPATDLSRPLKKLLDMGHIEKETPFGADEKNSKKSLYRISDPFLSFYYRFVVPNRSFVELERKAPITRTLNDHFHEFVSSRWERMCQDAVTGNEIDGILYGKAQRWWGAVLNKEKNPRNIEIDVVSESLDGKHLLIGECKWTSMENAKILTENLLQKAQLLPFAKDHIIVPKLFLKHKPADISTNVIFPQDVLSLFE